MTGWAPILVAGNANLIAGLSVMLISCRLSRRRLDRQLSAKLQDRIRADIADADEEDEQ
jgi:hypothetical protein